VPVGELDREPLEQEVGWTGWLWRRGAGERRLTDLGHAAAPGQTIREHRSGQTVQAAPATKANTYAEARSSH
jgi:hypothetical protein